MCKWDYKRLALRAAFSALSIVVGFSVAATEEIKTTSTTPIERTERANTITSVGANVITRKIDAGQSTFIVRASVGGLLSAFGHDHTIAVRDFTGQVRFAPGSLESSSLQIKVKADSLSITDKVSEKDRQEIEQTMREKVLETSKHPEIVFTSTSIAVQKSADKKYQAKIEGDLSLHGVTRRITIPAQVTEEGNALRASGEFQLRQTDFGIKPVSVAGGTIKVKDALKLTFDIVAR